MAWCANDLKFRYIGQKICCLLFVKFHSGNSFPNAINKKMNVFQLMHIHMYCLVYCYCIHTLYMLLNSFRILNAIADKLNVQFYSIYGWNKCVVVVILMRCCDQQEKITRSFKAFETEHDGLSCIEKHVCLPGYAGNFQRGERKRGIRKRRKTERGKRGRGEREKEREKKSCISETGTPMRRELHFIDAH